MSIVLSDEDAKTNIAVNVQALLDELGWNQADLARALEESEMRISLMIRAKKLSSAGFLARVAEVLHCKADDLLAAPRKKSRHSA